MGLSWFEISFKAAVETNVRRGKEGVGEGRGERGGEEGEGGVDTAGVLVSLLPPKPPPLYKPAKTRSAGGLRVVIEDPARSQVSALSQHQPGKNCMIGSSSLSLNFQY